MSSTRVPEGALLIHFGEPASSDPASVTAYLEGIFRANARLDAGLPETDATRRARELAERRAPALLRVYERIGGSPLNAQAAAQARALERELAARDRPVRVATGMQFTAPTIEDALSSLRSAGVARLAVVPVYPLCGPSTTVAALESTRRTLERLSWEPEVREVAGWHRLPAYIALRARTIRETAERSGVDVLAPDVEVVFSAHGTPMRYVRAGSRYVRYVEDVCARLADALEVPRYTLGYQNHANRGIEWTGPEIDEAIASLDGCATIVVDAVSFLHEQSETLAELDLDLADVAEALGLSFVRVPIPHDEPEVAQVLADLVEAALDAPGSAAGCRCRPEAAFCLNATAETPA